MRRAVFGEPSLAHRAEIGGVHATWHPYPRDDADRDQHRADADDEQHMVVAAKSGRRLEIVTRDKVTVCALVHKAFGTSSVGVIPCDMEGAGCRAPAGLACHVGVSCGLRVHWGTARFNAGAYT